MLRIPQRPEAAVETWRPVPGHLAYEVSGLGNVRSIDHIAANGRLFTGRILKQSTDDRGYRSVTLGHRGQQRVHCLVLLAFCGPPPKGMEVRHWDGVHSNNLLGNLVYGTRAQNIGDRARHGTSNRGERSARAILTEKQVRIIRTSTMRVTDLAAKFGVSQTTISDIRRGRNWAWMQ